MAALARRTPNHASRRPRMVYGFDPVPAWAGAGVDADPTSFLVETVTGMFISSPISQTLQESERAPHWMAYATGSCRQPFLAPLSDALGAKPDGSPSRTDLDGAVEEV